MRKALLVLPFLLLGAPSLSGCATFAEELDHFAFAAAAPLRDLNLTQTPIPGQLQALAQPYGDSDKTGCQAWSQEINDLEASLRANAGRRVGFRRDGGTFVGRTGNLRDSGVRAAVSQFVPYRAVIRQASGASRFEQQAERASDRARFRIGYLVGLARANRCPDFGLTSPFAPPQGYRSAWQAHGQSHGQPQNRATQSGFTQAYARHPAQGRTVTRTVTAQPRRIIHTARPVQQSYSQQTYPNGYPQRQVTHRSQPYYPQTVRPVSPTYRTIPAAQTPPTTPSQLGLRTYTQPHTYAPARPYTATPLRTAPQQASPVVTRRVYRPGASVPPATGPQW